MGWSQGRSPIISEPKKIRCICKSPFHSCDKVHYKDKSSIIFLNAIFRWFSSLTVQLDMTAGLSLRAFLSRIDFLILWTYVSYMPHHAKNYDAYIHMEMYTCFTCLCKIRFKKGLVFKHKFKHVTRCASMCKTGFVSYSIQQQRRLRSKQLCNT